VGFKSRFVGIQTCFDSSPFLLAEFSSPAGWIFLFVGVYLPVINTGIQ
jgi:hypothetical protein